VSLTASWQRWGEVEPLSDVAFRQLHDFVYARSGLFISGAKRFLLGNTACKRIRAVGSALTAFFDPGTQRERRQPLAGALQPGGYLFVDPKEPVQEVAGAFAVVHCPGARGERRHAPEPRG
jgi:hypothetical protein